MSLSRLTSWCFRRRRLVVVLWIVALISVSFLSIAAGADSRDNFALPGTSSQRAYELLGERFPEDAGDSAQVVMRTDGDVADTTAKPAFEALIASLATLEHVTGVDSPYADDQHRISADRKIAYADVHFDTRAAEVPVAVAKDLIDQVEAANTGAFQFEASGGPLEKAEQPEFGTAEIIGLLAAIIILLIAFGSLLAMGLPIVTALFGIGIGISLIALIGHLLDVPSFAPQVASMIGIGVGIDYALLIVTRFRDGLHRGNEPEQAMKIASATAGRAVMFAGTVVVISLLGLLLMNFAIVRGVAISASAAVLVTMLASITLLPALLGFAGHNIDRFRIPFRHNRVSDGERSLSYRWSRVVQHRPWPAALLGAAVLIVLALPLFGMRLGSADQGNNPEEFTSRRAYDLLAEGFGPGFNGPVLVVPDLQNAGNSTVVDQLVDTFNSTEGVAQAFVAARNDAGDAAIITVIPETAPQDKATDDLVKRLRSEVVPGTIAGSGAQVYVGGITASFIDFAERIGERLPIFIGGVIILSFLLLMVVFRSLLVPLKAAIMNLLSIGAAWRHRGRLPVGLARLALRCRQHGAHGAVGADDDVRGAVRPVDGLRGVPVVARARGVSPYARQRHRGCRWPGADRAGHHRGGRDHDRRVLQLRVGRHPRAQVARSRLVDRRTRRRDHRPHGARAGHDGTAGRRQLVVAPRAPASASPLRGRT